MKSKLNILCVLIFIAIIGSVADLVREGYMDFLWGAKIGYGMHERSGAPRNEPLYLSLKPERIGMYTDSVYNAKAGEWIPLQYRSVVVDAPETATPWWKQGLLMLCALIISVAIVIQLFVFCKFISEINKSVIFEWSNVFKLRLIGWSMLIVFFAHTLLACITYSINVDYVSISDYTLTFDGIFDFYQLILGLGVLLMGEVFAIGLRMREEQELTI